jgi:hypothetical protein
VRRYDALKLECVEARLAERLIGKIRCMSSPELGDNNEMAEE